MAHLGHVITGSGVTKDELKIDAVKAWPLPKTIKALRGFLGLTGYYRCFIHNYGIIATPLTALIKEAFRWSDDATSDFATLKIALASALVCNSPILPKSSSSTAMRQDPASRQSSIRAKGPSHSSAAPWRLNTEIMQFTSGNSLASYKSFDTGAPNSGQGRSPSERTIAA